MRRPIGHGLHRLPGVISRRPALQRANKLGGGTHRELPSLSIKLSKGLVLEIQGASVVKRGHLGGHDKKHLGCDWVYLK